ncbi:ribonuclease HIII [Metamycoplasma canadense]|uniref:Ribonuclease n=1 Tax=Metamycoplasma canadense TaxID=29554 RepID=A0A077L720_9BACT|nr:ribonuclease HIII [Metamycoplasma canadense]BAP39601.1 ribonuclease HII [Metamycoplasma canadense]
MLLNDLDYIGVDETGVGDYFTPIVSVACFIPKKNIELIKKLGVKDSKKISDNKISEIANYIIENKLVIFKKTILTQKGYNNLTNLKINNNAVKTLIHLNSIKRLLESLNKKIPIIIDQYANLTNISKHIDTLKNKKIITTVELKDFELILETKAEEKYLSVACASILARYILLEKMKEQSLYYKNFSFKLGASNSIIDVAILFVKKFGLDELKNVAKISFKTTNKVLEKLV